jgi:hypothetical protein
MYGIHKKPREISVTVVPQFGSPQHPVGPQYPYTLLRPLCAVPWFSPEFATEHSNFFGCAADAENLMQTISQCPQSIKLALVYTFTFIGFTVQIEVKVELYSVFK